MKTFLLLLQRIKELEERIEAQKRQIKELEEKVNRCGFQGFLCYGQSESQGRTSVVECWPGLRVGSQVNRKRFQGHSSSGPGARSQGPGAWDVPSAMAQPCDLRVHVSHSLSFPSCGRVCQTSDPGSLTAMLKHLTSSKFPKHVGLKSSLCRTGCPTQRQAVRPARTPYFWSLMPLPPG